MKADQACIVIFREKTAFRRYMICLFHVLDRLGSLRSVEIRSDPWSIRPFSIIGLSDPRSIGPFPIIGLSDPRSIGPFSIICLSDPRSIGPSVYRDSPGTPIDTFFSIFFFSKKEKKGGGKGVGGGNPTLLIFIKKQTNLCS